MNRRKVGTEGLKRLFQSAVQEAKLRRHCGGLLQALEVEQPVVELLAGLLVDVLAHLGGDGDQGGHGHEGGHLVGELVGVLAGRRHTHRAVRCAGRRPVSLTLLHGVDRVKRQSGQARSSRAPSSAAGAGHIVKERDEGLKQRDSKSRGEYSSPPSHPRWMRRNQQFSAGCRRYQPLT